MNQKRQIWIRVIALDMLQLCFSLSISLIGQMLDPIKTSYGINLSQGGLLLSMQSVGGLLTALVCILLVSVLNKTKLLVAGGLIMCAALMLMGLLPPLALLFVIFGLLGLSSGAINVLTNSTMLDTVPQKAERYIVFMHMLFSLGAVVTPFASQAIYPSVGLSGVFLIFGGFGVCWMIYVIFAFYNGVRSGWVTQSVSLRPMLNVALGVLKTPGMGIILFIAVIMTVWQLSAVYYISSLFTGITQAPMQGALALSLLFIGMLISRLIFSRFADRFSKGIVLLVTNAAAAVCWAAAFLVQDINAKYVFITLTTLASGNNFPIVFSAACRLTPRHAATASGFVNLGYYIAILVFIPIIGALGDSIGLGDALLLSGIGLLLMLPAGYLLHRRMNTSHMAPAHDTRADLNKLL